MELFASLGGTPLPVQFKQFKNPAFPLKWLNANTVEVKPKEAGELLDLFGATWADLAGLLGTSVVPGVRDFVVEARVGGRVADHVTIQIRVGPGQPQSVRLTEGGRVLQWNPVTHADEYSVYKVRPYPEQVAKELGVELELPLVGSTKDTRLRLDETTANDKTWKYVVVAKHTASQTQSVPSEYAKAGELDYAAILEEAVRREQLVKTNGYKEIGNPPSYAYYHTNSGLLNIDPCGTPEQAERNLKGFVDACPEGKRKKITVTGADEAWVFLDEQKPVASARLGSHVIHARYLVEADAVKHLTTLIKVIQEMGP